jgi:hypothetical protein
LEFGGQIIHPTVSPPLYGEIQQFSGGEGKFWQPVAASSYTLQLGEKFQKIGVTAPHSATDLSYGVEM